MGDLLFAVRNSFYLGAYNNVINEAADLDHLSDADAVERDCFVYRSYIALGSHEVRYRWCLEHRSLAAGFSPSAARCCAARRQGNQ